MKIIAKSIAATALVLAIAAPASAMVSPQLKQNIISAAGSGSNVNVIVNGDTVTLSGYVEDAYAFSQVMRAADSEGVSKVISNIVRTN